MKRAWRYRTLAAISGATIIADVAVWSHWRTVPAFFDIIAAPIVGLAIALVAWWHDGRATTERRYASIIKLLHDRGPMTSRQLRAFLGGWEPEVTILDVFLYVHALRRAGLVNTYGQFRLHSLTDAGFERAMEQADS